MRLIDKDALIRAIKEKESQDNIDSNWNNKIYATHEADIEIIENQEEIKINQ